MVLATWQLLTVQLLPRGADVAVHVIKKIKIKNKGLNMIIVLVIWASFDFRPCKK